MSVQPPKTDNNNVTTAASHTLPPPKKSVSDIDTKIQEVVKPQKEKTNSSSKFATVNTHKEYTYPVSNHVVTSTHEIPPRMLEALDNLSSVQAQGTMTASDFAKLFGELVFGPSPTKQ